MKLLLDTHIWIWLISSPQKLSRAVAREIRNPKNELYLSPISIWEVGQMARRGKLKTKLSFSSGIEHTLARPEFQEAPFNHAVAVHAAGLELPQSDPGDLFLAATASHFGLTLITADEQLLACDWLKTMPNE
jgi:PIN domain nuclease of toxin-antitoxin system